MITVNAKLICKVSLEEDDIQEQMKLTGFSRADVIYALAMTALPIELNVKDAEFTEL